MTRDFPRHEGWFFLDPRLLSADAGQTYVEQAFQGDPWSTASVSVDIDSSLGRSGLGWHVLRWPVLAVDDANARQTSQASRYRALVRSDTHEVISVVTTAYAYVEHRAVVVAALELAQAHDPTAWLLGSLPLGATGSELAACVVVTHYEKRSRALCVLATNSHGGEGAVRFRVVGLDRRTASVTASSGAAFQLREGHHGDLPGRLERLPTSDHGREWIQDCVDELGPAEHYLTERVISRTGCAAVVDALWPQEERAAWGPEGQLVHPREYLLDGQLAGKESCWDLYTQLCAYLDHYSDARERGDATKSRIERLVRGAGEALKARAVELILAHSIEDPNLPDDGQADLGSAGGEGQSLPVGTVVGQVSAWAGSPLGQAQAHDRYQQLSRFVERIPRGTSDYGRKIYDLDTTSDPELGALTDSDLVLLCDGGNGCYGGRVERMPTSTRVVVYTD